MLSSLRVDSLDGLFLPPTPPNGQTLEQLPAPANIVFLPKLLHLHIDERADGLAAAVLLSHLRLPRQDIRIRVDVRGHLPHEILGAQLFNVVGHFGAPHASLAASIDSPRCGIVQLAIWDRGSHLATYVPYDSWCLPRVICRAGAEELSFTEREKMAVVDRVQRSTVAFSKWLPENRLATLAVGVRLAPHMWLAAFPGAVNVARLHIRSDAAQAAMFLAPALCPGGAETPSGTTWKDPRSRMLFPSLGTLILDGMLWLPPVNIEYDADGERLLAAITARGMATDEADVRRTLGRALAKRGGLQQLIVRRGTGTSRANVEHVVREGNVANIDWDGQ